MPVPREMAYFPSGVEKMSQLFEVVYGLDINSQNLNLTALKLSRFNDDSVDQFLDSMLRIEILCDRGDLSSRHDARQKFR